MDPLAGLLDGPRARGAFLLKAVFSTPWSIRIEDRAPLSLTLVARGRAVFIGSGPPVVLGPGDVLLARGPEPYTVADAAETPVGVRILPGQQCVDPDGQLVEQAMDLGVRTWGNAVDGDTVMLIGTYGHDTAIGGRLLAQLPPALVLTDLDSPLAGLLAEEIVRDRPGQEAVLDRLLDLLLVTCLRRIFDARSAGSPSWYAAQHDPDIGTAIRLIHRHPERAWTVASLAGACSLSRSAFARKFTELVGEPAMTFLTSWRLGVAADLLAGGHTLTAVAARVGYANAFALSAAFKRVRGVTPREHRDAHRVG